MTTEHETPPIPDSMAVREPGIDGPEAQAIRRVLAYLDQQATFESHDFQGRLDVANDCPLFEDDLRLLVAVAVRHGPDVGAPRVTDVETCGQCGSVRVMTDGGDNPNSSPSEPKG